MWRILNYNNADDFVLATGETHTVKEFTDLAFKEVGIDLEWEGKGADEKGIVKEINWSRGEKLLGNSALKSDYKFSFSDKLKKGTPIVFIDPDYYRPTEVDLLIGNPNKAKEILGWEAKTTFNNLVTLMIKADLEKVMVRGY
jgi:GDPmannose 4,6-dehydratase